MKIAVIGTSVELQSSIDGLLTKYLPDYEQTHFSADEICRDALPTDTAAAFVLVEDMDSVSALRAVVRTYPALPVTVVSRSPDYALEAIRQSAKDYLIQPVRDNDFQRAIWRMNLPDEGGWHLARAITG